MKIAVLSGKGGAGKTFVAVNLAAAANRAVYIDCDVEEPNGHLFFKPEACTETTVTTPLPQFDADKCIGCRKCVDFCRFNALIFIRNLPRVFSEVCHACGGCSLVCPTDAVTETARPVGHIIQGRHKGVQVISGFLNPGEASGIPVIEAAIAAADPASPLTILDCPPGSACSVMESVSDSDYCILVAEPTAFGFHNFRMVHELAALLGKPCGVVINKQDTPYPPLEEYCAEQGLPILARFPYSRQLAELTAQGRIAAEENKDCALLFSRILQQTGGMQ